MLAFPQKQPKSVYLGVYLGSEIDPMTSEPVCGDVAIGGVEGGWIRHVGGGCEMGECERVWRVWRCGCGGAGRAETNGANLSQFLPLFCCTLLTLHLFITNLCIWTYSQSIDIPINGHPQDKPPAAVTSSSCSYCSRPPRLGVSRRSQAVPSTCRAPL